MAADFGISIAEKLIETIGSAVIKEVCDMWGYKAQLEELTETVDTIQKVLLDADNKRDLTQSEQHYINNLKDALYDADDLFDEVRTLAERDQLRTGSKSRISKLLKKVRSFFSSSRMSRDVKSIKKKLDEIADRHTKFGLSVDYKPIVRRREETCSYVDAKEIIGREQDKDAIIDMLLEHVDEEFRCVTIVGVGGLGKTTLAQLVYNDRKIQKEFELRAWVCVSDQEGQSFHVQTILCKILESFTNKRFDGSSTMELVQNQLQERLRGKKYLIVLDDVWNEERKEWLNLKNFLMLGQGGSRILVTTRSERTGAIISDEKNLYLLRGLSPEKSWHLFEMSAFKKGQQEHENHHEFIEIGRKIVENCHNVPLALKVVGSLLFDQDISKWRSFEKGGLSNIGKGDNQILSILKLSYHNLVVSLKSCFSYCAVFPKGRRLEKEMLINLWMAQGYITPLDGGQKLEDAAEEHFLILLRRCFFQDVRRDAYGYVKSVKIHDLMHDVAQEVGREEIQVMKDSMMNNSGNKIRHVHYVGNSHVERPHGGGKIRTFISSERVQGNAMVMQADEWRCLRVLVVSGIGLVKLPDSIGKLRHLRYLDVSRNSLEMLPNSITRLHNLQTLLLEGCGLCGIKELPKDFCKLVNLRHLDLSCNYSLECMPSGLEKLTSLKVLSYFVVGKKKVVSREEEQRSDDELKPLQALTGIRGEIWIEIGKYYYRKVVESREAMGGGGYLKAMEHLTRLRIEFDSKAEAADNHEAALETLDPPSNIKELRIEKYKGSVIPKWGRAVDNWAINLSHLAQIILSFCPNLQEMPVLSNLRSLKILHLSYLDKIEYMETSSDSSQASESEVVFFPSLVHLDIWNLPRLKGWWKGVDDAHPFNTTFMFPCLEYLEIQGCPDLMSFPPNNEALQIEVRAADEEDDNNVVTPKLRVLKTDILKHLKSLPINLLTNLTIQRGDKEMDKADTLENVAEEFQRCASTLQFLEFHNMKNVSRLFGGSGLAHFTALETLQIRHIIPRFFIKVEGEDEDEDGENSCLFWKSFPPNLRKLRFWWLYKDTSLPKGMQYLTSLQTLALFGCSKLEGIPDWIDCLSSLQSLSIDDCPGIRSIPASMQKLTSLQRLEISRCPELQQRCQEPDGEDCPKIRHIPHIQLDIRC